MSMKHKKVFVAMSGGVDSSVATAFLKERLSNQTFQYLRDRRVIEKS